MVNSPTRAIRSPMKRSKMAVNVGKCFIVLVGLSCGICLRISYGVVTSSHVRQLQENDANAIAKNLKESRKGRSQLHKSLSPPGTNEEASSTPTAKAQRENREGSSQVNKSMSALRTIEQDSSKPQQAIPTVYERFVTLSYSEVSTKELMSLAGADYSPCLPQKDVCDLKKGHTIRAFNSWHHPRYYCGHVIGPKAFLDVKKACHEGIRIFEEEPSLKVVKITPIDLLMGTQDTAGLFPQSYQCTVPCQQYGTPGTYQTVFVGGTDFQFKHSMESSINYDELRIRPDDWRNNMFYATTSFKSEVPLPYFSWAEYSLQKPAVDYNSSIKGASFIANNCASRNNREGIVTELMKMMRVDSLGGCLNKGAGLPEGSDQGNKESMMNKYLLHFSFENSNEEDYITEKLWGAFASGTLPVYMGAPNVQDHVPEHSIISWHDFQSTQALGKYLQEVIANKTLYESYHEWRGKPLSEKFHRRYDMTHTHSVCRGCKFVYAKTRGWGWNSERQEMTDLALPREVCLDGKGAIVYPFVETVVGSRLSSPGGIADNSTNCNASAAIPTAATVGPWQRTVWYHDGVIDITLDGKSTDVYRILAPFVAPFKVLQTNVYRLQSGVSRMTIVGNSILQMSVHAEGVLDIRVPPTCKEPQRLRVIIEDIDTFHDGANLEQNYFGKLMVEEFQHPLLFAKKANGIVAAD